MKTSPLLRIYPELAALVSSEPFVASVAEDFWIHSVGPWLRIADLISGNGHIWTNLIKVAPELKAFDISVPDAGDEAAAYRSYARRSAIMSVAVACQLGQASFLTHSMLAGDANLKVQLSDGILCRIGPLKDVSWKPSPSKITKVVQILENAETLAFIELSLFPIAGVSDEDFREQFRRWKILEPLRSWDHSHRTGIILRKAAELEIPVGYRTRYTAPDISSTGIPFTVAAKISSPYASPLIQTIIKHVNPPLQRPDDLVAWALSRSGGA